jgi:signal transduction histidine kinase
MARRPRVVTDADGAGALDQRRLHELIEVGANLLAELDPEEVFERVLEVACELTGARYAALGVLDSDRGELERFITRGIDHDAAQAIGSLPRGRGVLGLLIEEPRPLRLSEVGSHPRSYGFPPGHPPMSSFLGVPIVIRGEAWGNLYLTEKRGGAFDEADEQSASILAGWLGIAVENARLYRRVEAQRDEMERAVRSLEATTEIARAIGGETNLDRILEMIVKRGRALVKARSMLILLRDHDEMVVAAAAGEFPQDLLGERTALSRSISGQVIATGRAERFANVSDHLRFALGHRIDAQTGLFVPLLYRGTALGVLNAFNHEGEDEFSPEDQRLLESFAASAATAVAMAQSIAEQRVSESIQVAERERGRWARELHDEALQSMGGLRVLLSTARRGDGGREIDGLLAQAIERIDHAIAEMRRLIADLRPPTLDELGLGAAVEALVERLKWGRVLDVELSIDLAHETDRHPTRLLSQVEDTIYRLTQEALNNAAKHSESDRASVEVREAQEMLTVRIKDGGRGFDPQVETEGFGLRGMSERVALAGGRLNVLSAPGKGTLVEASLPARHRSHASTHESDRETIRPLKAADEVGDPLAELPAKGG